MAKVYSSKAEYEQEFAALTKARALVRTWFVRCQEGKELPEGMRRLSGIEYREIDARLTTQLDACEEKWKITRWMWATSDRPGKHKYQDNGSVGTWKVVSEQAAHRLNSVKGNMVRTTGEGKTRKWEVLE